ncbi:MAG: hypothetical protein FWD65_01545 [Coriobacteriia bacterium]|nr:hypothetical protein [Coriobacteriia bacterium]
MKAAKRLTRVIVLVVVVSLCAGLPVHAVAKPKVDLSKGIGGDVAFASGLASCQIGSTSYKTLTQALKAVPGRTHTTIKLLGDIVVASECTITNKQITFDLNGHSLTFNSAGDFPLTLTKCTIDYTGAGTLQVMSGQSVGLTVDGGSCTLTHVDSGALNAGIWCENGAKLTLNGSAKETNGNSSCIRAGERSSVTINGDVSATGGTPVGLYVIGGSTAVVNGNITAGGEGIHVASSGEGNLPRNANSQVTVKGNVTCGSYVEAVGNPVSVHITGNLTCTKKGWGAVYVNGGAQVTVDGVITSAGSYIDMGIPGKPDTDYETKTAKDFTTPTTKQDYKTYTNGQSTVWVGNAQAPAASQDADSTDASVPDAGPADNSTSSSSATQVATPASDSQKPLPSSSDPTRFNTKILFGILAGVLFIAAATVLVITVRRSRKQPVK